MRSILVWLVYAGMRFSIGFAVVISKLLQFKCMTLTCSMFSVAVANSVIKCLLHEPNQTAITLETNSLCQ